MHAVLGSFTTNLKLLGSLVPKALAPLRSLLSSKAEVKVPTDELSLSFDTFVKSLSWKISCARGGQVARNACTSSITSARGKLVLGSIWIWTKSIEDRV